MTALEQLTQRYAEVLRQLLPVGGYDTAATTVISKDIQSHAKALAQADIDGQRPLKAIDGYPVELLGEYEFEFGLPLRCTIDAAQTIDDRLQLLREVAHEDDVISLDYLRRVFGRFNIDVLEVATFRPTQCNAGCLSSINSERLRYKVALKLKEPLGADVGCIIDNYLPAFIRYDIQTED